MYHIFIEHDCYYYVNEMTAKDVLEDAHDRDGRRVDVYDAAEETRYVIEREGYELQTFDTQHEVDGYQGKFDIEPIDSWVDRKCEEYNIQKRHTYSYVQ